MYIFITILIVIFSLALIFFVVIQNSKGGGLAAGFSSSNQVMGVRKTTDFLEKATATLAGLVVLGSIIASVAVANKTSSSDDSLKNEIINLRENTTNPNTTAPFGTAVPDEESGTQTPVE
ncbi:preprotein translocase subunit SecG [Bacteroidia bacterium]|nr:preprotein translocase subunit SecG [Bacteroidia bacterium]GHV31712.1 preprotein translocase subunit SecG [Bacteroidia bacterium]